MRSIQREAISDHRSALAAAELARALLVRRLQICLQELGDGVLALMRGDRGGAVGIGDTQFVLGQRAAVMASLRWWLMAIERGGRWSGSVPPEVDVLARRAALSGVCLSAALDACTMGYELAWGLVLQEAQAIEGLETRMEVLVAAWASTASLFACLVRAVTVAHTDESERRGMTRRRRDDERLLALLSGRPGIDLRGIDYDFNGYHLGLIADGLQAAEASRLLATTLGCNRWIIERDAGSAWAWLQSSSPISTEDVERCLLAGPHTEVIVVGGRIERGIKGFRLTHQQAQTALRVARRSSQRITWYADVDPVAMVLQNEELAQSMIARWITPILQDRNGDALLRTLRAFFASEQNQAHTAEALPASRNTVERHLHRIEALIGRAPQACGAQVELALQVYEFWGGCGQPAAC